MDADLENKVSSVREAGRRYQYNHGIGQRSLGLVSMWIMLDQSWGRHY